MEAKADPELAIKLPQSGSDAREESWEGGRERCRPANSIPHKRNSLRRLIEGAVLMSYSCVFRRHESMETTLLNSSLLRGDIFFTPIRFLIKNGVETILHSVTGNMVRKYVQLTV